MIELVIDVGEDRPLRFQLGDGGQHRPVGVLQNAAGEAIEIGEAEFAHHRDEAAAADLVAGGERLSGEGRDGGYFYAPTIFADVSNDMRIAQEEIFGPVVSVIEARDFHHAIHIANDIQYGLSTAIYTQNVNKAFEAIEWLESGITYVNSSTIGAEIHLPFGGVKKTGHGREAGWTAIEEFSEEKAVYVDYSNTLQKAQGID